jgi:hypothetical protein
MINSFLDHPVFSKRYFRRQFWISLNLFRHIAECAKLHDWFRAEEELHRGARA